MMVCNVVTILSRRWAKVTYLNCIDVIGAQCPQNGFVRVIVTSVSIFFSQLIN